MVNRDAPATFVVGVVAASVPFWLLGDAPLGLPVNLPVGALLAVVPALVTLALAGPHTTARHLRAAVRPGAVRPRAWYAPLILTMPLVLVATGGVPALSVPTLTLLALLVPLLVVAAVAEEIGWTGHLYPRCRRRLGSGAAAVAVGVPWAGIHLPGWSFQTGHGLGWTLGMAAVTVAVRVLIVELGRACGGPLPAAVIVHATVNLVSLPFPDRWHPWLVAPAVLAAALICRRLSPASC